MPTFLRILGPALLLLLLLSGAAQAHKVNIFAYVQSGTVYTESYFPDGRPVAEGTISVYDPDGTRLLQGTTDQEGLFSFPVPKTGALTIEIEAGMGHKSSFQLSRSEVEAGQ